MYKPQKILFAPLDWGLGHASRCIPLIEECLSLGHTVLIAGDKRTNNLIQQEFPQLQCLLLKGYEISYSSSKWLFPFSILLQIPKIINRIKWENKWLNKIVEHEKIDIVFSDNRYGLYHPKIPCYFITHQVTIQVPQSSFLQRAVNRINHNYIKKFTVCLVPDYQNENMSGKLSLNTSSLNVKYLGNLSRFQPTSHQDKKYDLLLLLSGPEPQRSILEEQLVNYFKNYQGRILLVRGIPLETKELKLAQHFTSKNYMNATELQEAILNSTAIICRSGYSTIMDLIKLNKHAIVIPTPGQTEQEYLGTYLNEKKWFKCIKQESINEVNIQESIKHLEFNDFPNWDMNMYKSVVEEILNESRL